MAKVLVIDDDSALRRMIVRILARGQHQVIEAENGLDGLRKFRAERPDVVLTDIVMPDMNGADLARFLCALRPELRVLYMSGYSDGALGDKFVLPKDVAFLQKPFSRLKLAHKLREVLDSNLIAAADRLAVDKSES